MEAKYSKVYMEHIFLIHSSIEGHLGSFHSLATVAIAAINIGVQIAIGVQMALLFLTQECNYRVIGKFYF